MTINNLHKLCDEPKFGGKYEFIITKKEYEESGTDLTKNYDNTNASCKKAIEQLKIVKQVMENFNELSYNLE